MSIKIEPCDDIEVKLMNECDCNIFENQDEMRRSISRLCYGDLYVIGRLWIETMRTVLVGSKLSFIPVVEAKTPEKPEKPPRMKCKDLPIYKSPHYEYYEYEQDKLKCKDYNKKIMQERLLPSVRDFRRTAQRSLRDTRNYLNDTYKNMCSSLAQQRKDIETYCRCPSRLCERRIGVILGATLGMLIGYKTGKGVMKPFFFSGLGGFGVGALCFPKETDETFRNLCFHTGRVGIGLYNFYCKKNFALRERIPCERDIPTPPKTKRKEQCPVKK